MKKEEIRHLNTAITNRRDPLMPTRRRRLGFYEEHRITSITVRGQLIVRLPDESIEALHERAWALTQS